MIVIVFGLPGSGKSYFASRLAEKIGAGYANSERIRKERIAKRTYSEKEKAAVYAVMLEEMKQAVDENRSLVLDATFHKDETRQLFIQQMKEKEGIVFIEVRAKEVIVRERLKKERPYSDADFNVYKLIQQHWEPMSKSHLLLESTDENIDDMLQKAMNHLQQKK